MDDQFQYDEQMLLTAARNSILSALGGKGSPEVETFEIDDVGGIFVTLKNGGVLRGCIGHINITRITERTLKEVSANSATSDPRFNSVSLDEIEEIDIEISVLSKFEQVQDVSEIIIGEHGLFMRNSFNQGLLLPQVAVEQGFSRQEFLEHTCMKSGLGKNCWKDSDTEIFKYTARIFSEK